MENEIWKDIDDFDGFYMVSNHGRIKSIERVVIRVNRHGTTTNQFVPTKILKPSYDKDGYLTLSLSKNGKADTYRVHRLVAKHFIPNLDNKPEVNHIDETKSNNRVENLEWCTNIENIRHGTGILRRQLANIRPVIQYDLEGNFIRQWQNYYDAADNHGVSFKAISSAVVNKRCSAGFQWRKIKKGETIKPIAPYDNKNNRIIYQFDKNNQFVKKFNSMADAAKKTNIDRASINKVSLVIRKSAGGFLWSYEAKRLGLSINHLK